MGHNVRIMGETSDSDYDSDSEPFDINEVVCVGIDSAFCKLAFQLKHLLYSKLILQNDAQKNTSQDIDALKNYESSLDSVHSLLYGLFTQQNSPDDGIPQEVEENVPEEMREALRTLYQESCNAYRNNNDPRTHDTYRVFIHNIFHVYPYEMSRADIDDESE